MGTSVASAKYRIQYPYDERGTRGQTGKMEVSKQVTSEAEEEEYCIEGSRHNTVSVTSNLLDVNFVNGAWCATAG